MEYSTESDTYVGIYGKPGDGYVYWHPRNNVSLVIQGGDLDSYPSMAKNTGEDTQKWKIIKDETSRKLPDPEQSIQENCCNRKLKQTGS